MFGRYILAGAGRGKPVFPSATRQFHRSPVVAEDKSGTFSLPPFFFLASLYFGADAKVGLKLRFSTCRHRVTHQEGTDRAGAR